MIPRVMRECSLDIDDTVDFSEFSQDEEITRQDNTLEASDGITIATEAMSPDMVAADYITLIL